ncbi:tRNA dihydrouridine synthase DusB [Demetria terragena]|uniref:tRNA dihydrouridine synthase DusB n=1 Tax=Demetria terragena TaxID=63959 RepID=UPI00036CDFFF|nr:tRNA dihydrouridine synthase DusB [Demetria terragena]
MTELLTPTAHPVLPPLQIGRHTISSPVVLAPMAGITNRAFRRLCRQYGAQGAPADGGAAPSGATSLYVSEMITSRALVERTPVTMQLIEHDPDEAPRSIQLYSVDPVTAGRAVHILASENRCDHIDLNFGCPVPKVTRKGGGGALPWKSELFRSIVSTAVRAAAPYDIPVTVKMRKGIDDRHLTFLEAGRIAEGEGAAAVALHGRTVAQSYSGQADWSAIRDLKQAVTSIPVLGNGDIWSAEDAVRMVHETGCDGVVVGRGCLGRPWLFTDLAAAFAGSDLRVRPTLGEVCETLRRHAAYLTEFHGSEEKGCRDIRKHISWYLKGFRVGSHVRSSLATVVSLSSLDDLVATLDLDQDWPADADGPRGRAGSERRVVLPEGWLDSRELDGVGADAIAAAELSVSGG